MKTHKEIFRAISRILPDLDNIAISKEPFLLEREREAPLNVHVMERKGHETVLALCQYPRSEWGGPVPSPDVEFRLDYKEKAALPMVYIDRNGRTDLDEKFRSGNMGEAMDIDSGILSWLLRLEK